MTTLFNTLPKHTSVFNLFPQQQQGHQPPRYGGAVAPTSAAQDDGEDDLAGMDESFELADASLDAFHAQGDYEGRDVSFASTLSLGSPLSSPSPQVMQSSPYGMDICSPSPGHPLYGKRLVAESTVVDSGSKLFGQHLAPKHHSGGTLLLPSRNHSPGGLLRRLTENPEDTSFSLMSTGSVRSNGTNRSGSGKMGSIKTSSIPRSQDTASKARARSRGALPSSWMNPSRLSAEIQLPQSQTETGLMSSREAGEDHEGDGLGDVSMEDAMEVDSPLAARGPPKADVRPRPLSLFIPSMQSAPSPLLSQGDDSPGTPPLVSAISRDGDQFAAHFQDTPEPEIRTAVPHYLEQQGEDGSPLARPFGFSRPADSSPVTSPSAQRLERCLSAGIYPPTSSSASLAAALSSAANSSRGSLTANPFGSKPSIGSHSRIPSLRAAHPFKRPGLATMGNAATNGEAQESHSANVVPSARMTSLHPRRAISAFIQPEQLHSAPFSGSAASSRTVGSRTASNGRAKGRVVSMLLPSTGLDDADDTSSGAEGAFNSPSLSRLSGAAHRRMRSNGGSHRDAAVGYQTGSMRARSAFQHHQQQGSLSSLFDASCTTNEDPSPLKPLPLLPFASGEHSGKVLPCHSVKDDGLMRISPATMQAMLSGAFDAQIASYTVIDCRFAYEFAGGHIKGAVNLNKDEEIERFLFEETARRGLLPAPSQSGAPGVRQQVLIFHCEFSAKRGPTFAKHFRGKDRGKNAAEYPRLHYPELYILEGGYCSYFSAYPETCEPRGYVQMDAPQHSQARAADLGQFRRWNRARSYTYGDSQMPNAGRPQAAISTSTSTDNNTFHRTSSSLGVNAGRYPSTSLNGGAQRRGQSIHSLHTLQEHHASLEESDRQAVEETFGDFGASDNEEPEATQASEGAYEEEEFYDAEDRVETTSLDGDDLQEFGALSPGAEEQYHEEQPAEEEEEEDEEEEFDNFSSPCVTAEMKRGKSRGKQLLEKTFKPLSFKPFSLSLAAPKPIRGLSRATSHAA